MKIALDAMGGDLAPGAVIAGSLQALALTPADLELILVGDPDALKSELGPTLPARLHIHPTTQVVAMDDKAANILKTKPDSSIVQGLQLVKEGRADGFISAGNTGAVMTVSLLLLGRIPGVRRPALAAYIPTVTGGKILCDVGVNPDAKPFHIMQFAIMASHYLSHVAKITNPRIGLVNIGTESNKGSELYQETYHLLKKELKNFIGNVEGRHLLDGEAEVLVCDGFVGNTILKFAEGWINIFSSEVKSRIADRIRFQLGAWMLKPVFDSIKIQYDYEEYGGSPLLGVNGVSVICHGSSGSKAIKNSILVTKRCIDKNLIHDTRISVARHLGV